MEIISLILLGGSKEELPFGFKCSLLASLSYKVIWKNKNVRFIEMVAQ
jgi:hypothetical protein